MTLAKSTDTPKARPVAIVTVSKAKALEFVTLTKSTDKARAEKARIIGTPVHKSGAILANVLKSLNSALNAAGLPDQSSTEARHYCDAYGYAASHKFAAIDDAILAAHSISTGVVPKKRVAAWMTAFSGSAEEFAAGCRQLRKDVEAEKKAGKGSTKKTDTAPAKDADAVTVTDENEDAEVETISPLAEIAPLLKKLAYNLDLLANDDSTEGEEYTAALHLLDAFSRKYIVAYA